MKRDPLIAEVRKVRAELDKEHPTSADFYRHLKERERTLKSRLIRRRPVKLPPVQKTG